MHRASAECTSDVSLACAHRPNPAVDLSFLFRLVFFFFFFNDTATTEIYPLSLHDALPICGSTARATRSSSWTCSTTSFQERSEEHTSELQSRLHLVCRLLLEKKQYTQSHNGASAELITRRMIVLRLTSD